jgi:hypothetical protein
MADKDSCMENCAHFGFTDCLPGAGYGSNWFCQKEGKRIKKAHKKCENHVDRYKKIMINNQPKEAQDGRD